MQCFDEARNTCVLSPACRLRTALGEAEKAFYATLSSYTLADLVRPAAARQVIKAVIASAE